MLCIYVLNYFINANIDVNIVVTVSQQLHLHEVKKQLKLVSNLLQQIKTFT